LDELTERMAMGWDDRARSRDTRDTVEPSLSHFSLSHDLPDSSSIREKY
jgi:hypothetical protein